MKILVTCPPMLHSIDRFRSEFEIRGATVTVPEVLQVLSEEELLHLVPQHDGWIIGDDPASYAVLAAGKSGRLRAAVKWGIGVDNVDLSAGKKLGIPIQNTPGLFGAEVADLALSYVLALARQTFLIDRGVRSGDWPKPQGISLAGRCAAVLGLGDIGRHLITRLQAVGLKVTVCDPYADPSLLPDGARLATWPEAVNDADFLVVTCALTDSSAHLVNAATFEACKPDLRVVNVSRGGVIDEVALCEALRKGQVHSAALDVFEQEPLPRSSYLLEHPLCLLGTHNGSNTAEAVQRASLQAINSLFDMLGRDM